MAFSDDIIVAKDLKHLRSLISNRIKEQGLNCDLNDIDVHNIKDMSNLFRRLASINDNLCNFDGNISEWDTSNVTNMSGMFWGSKFNGDISLWVTTKVTNMNNMFQESLFDKDLSTWDVRNVKKMRSMFYNSKFTGDISMWDVSHVNDASYMFAYSKFDVSNIDIWTFSRGASIQGFDIKRRK